MYKNSWEIAGWGNQTPVLEVGSFRSQTFWSITDKTDVSSCLVRYANKERFSACLGFYVFKTKKSEKKPHQTNKQARIRYNIVNKQQKTWLLLMSYC